MKTWSQSLRDAMLSGSIASMLSTITLGASGLQENGTPYAPTNAISHWFYGERAAHHDEPSLRHTALGYAIHHASSTFWAVFYEKWFGNRAQRGEIVAPLAGGMAVAALACFVDYKMTPQRLKPGFEKRLSTRALWLVYASFGIGLAVRGLTASDRQHTSHS